MQLKFRQILETYTRHGEPEPLPMALRGLPGITRPVVKPGPEPRERLAEVLQVYRPDSDEHNDLIGSAFYRAIDTGDEVAVGMILNAGADPTLRYSEYTPTNALLHASECGLRDTVKLLWERVGPEGRFLRSSGEPGTSGTGCLVVAARHGHVDLVLDFFEMWDGWTDAELRGALRDAASAWCEDAVTLLLSRILYEADAIQDALEASVWHKRVFPDRYTGYRDPNDNGDFDQQYRMVRQLISAGADPNGVSHKGRLCEMPMLQWAISSVHAPCLGHQCVDRVSALKALLENGADPNAQDKFGKTALHILFQRPLWSMPALRLLLEYGVSLELADEEGETPLHTAARSSTLESFQFCLAQCGDASAAIQQQTLGGDSLLHYAAAGARQDTVEFLLAAGLAVDSTTKNGWTPLHCAIMPLSNQEHVDNLRMARCLLGHGASAQAVTTEGVTALHALVSHPSYVKFRESEDITSFARELIGLGVPLDAEASLINDPPPSILGMREQWWSRRGLKPFSDVFSKCKLPITGAEPENAALMWAYRRGHMGIFNAIMDHWASNAMDES